MDLLKKLNDFINKNNIKNAIILNGIGSVTDYRYHVVSSKDLPPSEEYPKASVAKDLISMQGYIMNKRVHAHITLADEHGALGGHLEEGTKSLTFFILTIGILPDDLEIANLDSF
jgi:predicted DNA-binding protein with PD1-like motif